jgi:hypothetical protein
VLDFTTSSSKAHPTVVSGINFNQLFKGIDVTIGAGNPGANGVQLAGAQGSSIQDSTITVGSGYAGVVGGAGAGGSHAMVTVIGGKVGMDYTVSLNTPSVIGATLIGQTIAAISYDGLEAASVVGTTIKPAKGAVALLVTSTNSKWGEVSVVDSRIELDATDPPAAAFVTTRSLYLRNVYVKGSAALIKGGPALQPTGWNEVHEFVGGMPIPGKIDDCNPTQMPVYVNGVRSVSQLSNITATTAPPSNLTSQHSWGEETFPSLDMRGAVSAMDYGALGDGLHDDTAAIQKALDQPGAVVLLPKGFYRVSATLTMPKGGAVALIGVARHLSVLMPVTGGVGTLTKPAPVLHVSNPDERIVVSMFSIALWEHLANTYALQFDNHHLRSTYRQNYFYRTTECLYGTLPNGTIVNGRPTQKPEGPIPCRPSAVLHQPLNVITGSMMAYNFENEDFLYEAPEYRHMLVADTQTTDRVHFYQANFEHSMSEANMEVRDSRGAVRIYSYKSEGEWRDLYSHGGRHNPDICIWIRNATNVHVYSLGGNMRPPATGSKYPAGYAQYPPSLFRLSDGSCDVVLTNLVDQFQFPPVSEWNMVYDEFGAKQGQGMLTRQCDRPVLFRRSC